MILKIINKEYQTNYNIEIQIAAKNAFTHLRTTQQKELIEKLKNLNFEKISPYIVPGKIAFLYPSLIKDPNKVIIFIKDEEKIQELIKHKIIEIKEEQITDSTKISAESLEKQTETQTFAETQIEEKQKSRKKKKQAISTPQEENISQQ